MSQKPAAECQEDKGSQTVARRQEKPARGTASWAADRIAHSTAPLPFRRKAQPEQRPAEPLAACPAAIFRGANAKDQHAQGKQNEEELDVLAIDLRSRQDEEVQFVFHVKSSFSI